MVQKDRVHRLPDRLVAAKGEGKVGDAARDMHMRQPGADTARRFDEGDFVIVVFLDARCDREDVRVEDDVLGGEADALCEKPVGALADRKFALGRLGLSAFIERHHDDGRAIAQNLAGVIEKGFLALLHADGIDDRLALHAFKARLDHRPFGGVDHHRNAGYVRLRGDEIEEGRHGLFGIKQALVHVHVEHIRAALDLLTRNSKRCVVGVRLDQLSEFCRAGDVGPLADDNELLACAGH